MERFLVIIDVMLVLIFIWYDFIFFFMDSLYFVINLFVLIGRVKLMIMVVFSRGVNLIIVGGFGIILNFIIVMVIYVYVLISLIWYV